MALFGTDINSEVKFIGKDLFKAQVAGVVNGTGFDVKKDVDGPFESLVVCVALGVATGTPTQESLVLKMQDSSDNSAFADYKDESGAVVQTVVGLASAIPGTNDNGKIQMPVRSRNSRQYMRVVYTLGFTGGTSPAQDILATVIAAGGPRNVQAQPNS